jgi:uncharacterized membrane protein HdeD (DUF308 family)
MTTTESKPTPTAPPAEPAEEAAQPRFGAGWEAWPMIGPGLHLSRKFVGRLRVWLILRGVLGLVLGGLILFSPGLSIAAFALLVGVFFCVVGVARIVVGAADSEFTTGVRVLNVVFGLLLVGLGAVSIRYPEFGLLTTVFIIGFAWLMEGGATLAVLPPRHQGRAWAIVFAVVSLLAGLTVLLWPVASILPLTIAVGALLAVGGVVDIVNAAVLRPGDRPRRVE